MHDPALRRWGTLLVVLQLMAIAWLAFAAAPVFLQGEARWPAWMAAFAAAGLGLWALSCNRPGNFNVHPAPRADGVLISDGPYRYIRHPMYTAVMLGGLACWLARGSWGTGLVSGLLVGVLIIKASLEEAALLRVHPAYAGYRERTRRFLPGLY